jgi:hypothetical protein
MANMVDNGLTILEKYQVIADDYAIGFAEWLLIEPEDDSMEKCTTKELLEIYKKEKGL